MDDVVSESEKVFDACLETPQVDTKVRVKGKPRNVGVKAEIKKLLVNNELSSKEIYEALANCSSFKIPVSKACVDSTLSQNKGDFVKTENGFKVKEKVELKDG